MQAFISIRCILRRNWEIKNFFSQETKKIIKEKLVQYLEFFTDQKALINIIEKTVAEISEVDFPVSFNEIIIYLINNFTKMEEMVSSNPIDFLAEKNIFLLKRMKNIMKKRQKEKEYLMQNVFPKRFEKILNCSIKIFEFTTNNIHPILDQKDISEILINNFFRISTQNDQILLRILQYLAWDQYLQYIF